MSDADESGVADGDTTAASDEDTTTSDADTATSDEDTTTSDADTATSDADTTTSDADTAASDEDTIEPSDTDTATSDADATATSDADEPTMRATCRALSDRGYANLTMQAIADEADVSKAALHYHYDSKQELLASFQAYLGDRFLARVRAADTDGPADERLASVLDAALSPPESDDLADLQTALLELKAQAPYEPAFREQSRIFDEDFRTLLTDILETGVAEGTFRADLDPERVAQFVVTVLAGSQTRQVSVGQPPAVTRALLETYVEATLRPTPEADRE